MDRKHYREPPIDTVIRHLCRASDVAEKRRVVVAGREAIGFALTQAFKEQTKLRGNFVPITRRRK